MPSAWVHGIIMGVAPGVRDKQSRACRTLRADSQGNEGLSNVDVFMAHISSQEHFSRPGVRGEAHADKLPFLVDETSGHTGGFRLRTFAPSR